MYNRQAEAIEDIDALMNNAGLPTYSELAEALRNIKYWAAIGADSAVGRANGASHEVSEAAILLSRIPT